MTEERPIYTTASNRMPRYRCPKGHERSGAMGQVWSANGKPICDVCAAEWAAEQFPMEEVRDA